MKKLGQKGICVVATLLYLALAGIAGSFAVDAFSGNLKAPAGQVASIPSGNTSYFMTK